MFFFGFAALFVVTQMHGLGLPKWVHWIVYAAFLGGIWWVYSDRGWGNVNEVFRIPIIDYGLVVILGGALVLVLWLIRRRQRAKSSS